jgi:cob(I)alamin adenosyltransferase
MPNKGLLIVYTGDGKGKTTAAWGLAFRALGHGHKVLVIQFIKGSWKYGELKSVKRFSDLLDFYVMGDGMTFRSKDREKSHSLACQAWRFAKERIQNNEHRLIILDELTYLIHYEMVTKAEVLDTLRNRPVGMHVLITGRNASPDLLGAADIATEMRLLAHPYKLGVHAQEGIEF